MKNVNKSYCTTLNNTNKVIVYVLPKTIHRSFLRDRCIRLTMPILFSAVASEKVILSRFACCEGNFTEIADVVLSKISPQNGKCTYFHGSYLFNYIAENGHLYFCITDKSCQRSRAFLFLNQIKRRLGAEGRASLLQMLTDEMYRYSEDYNTIVIHKGELDELNTIGVRSSEEILGEKLLLVESIENLNYGTITYLAKAASEVMISNNDAITSTQEHISFLKNSKTEPVATYNTEICISNNELDSNKSRRNLKIVVAMFLLGLAIYISDLMPSGHVFLLVLFVIYVLFR